MNNPTTFYIVRHGESEQNAQEKSDEYLIKQTLGSLGSSLTTKGKKQAKKRGNDLALIPFDAVFSSDFIRAKHTAEIIIQGRNLPVITKKILRERYWGNVNGKLAKAVKEELTRLRKGLSDEAKMRVKVVEDAESEEEGMKRLQTFLQETASIYPGKTLLVVAHGNIMRMYLIKVGFSTYDELPAGSIENTGYFVLKSDGVDFEIVETVGIEKN